MAVTVDFQLYSTFLYCENYPSDSLMEFLNNPLDLCTFFV